MEIKKLREDKFEVSLHIDDLEKFNINFSEFMSKKIEDLDLFPLLLNYIDKLSNISLKNKKIIFETFFINNSYFLIEFYIIGILSSDGNFVPKIGDSLSVSDKVPLIFRFSSFDSLCDFSNYLSLLDKDKLHILLDFIKFYKYKDNYFVLINDSIFYTDLFYFACLQISEFAEFVSCSNILVKKVEEFGYNIDMYKDIM